MGAVRQATYVCFPNIVRDPAIQGGDPVIASTRSPVHDVVLTWEGEHDVAAVLQAYPRLTEATLREALAYYDAHRDEQDALIAAQLADA
jgi:uncharacterized protein (DUF433 family)